jgi:pyridoxal phosphate enzyme (YggS family)
MMDIFSDNIRAIHQRYQTVLEKVERAAISAGRRKEEIQVVVVSKSQPLDVVQSAIQAGITIFGENYAEEGAEKIGTLSNQSNLEWHMIGHVQSRKAKTVSDYFQRIHSLDSISLSQKLEIQLAEKGKMLPALLEFNIAGEESKSGWDASNPAKWEDLFKTIEPVFLNKHLQIDGIMIMPPLSDDELVIRSNFLKARKLLEELNHRFPNAKFRHLSMGTSADYEIAVQEGATFVRIGQAILGARVTRG